MDPNSDISATRAISSAPALRVKSFGQARSHSIQARRPQRIQNQNSDLARIKPRKQEGEYVMARQKGPRYEKLGDASPRSDSIYSNGYNVRSSFALYGTAGPAFNSYADQVSSWEPQGRVSSETYLDDYVASPSSPDYVPVDDDGSVNNRSTAPTSIYGNDRPFQDVFGGGSDWNGGNEMWDLPPGAAFFQNVNGQGVTQTAEGVNVGGMDLLDFMELYCDQCPESFNTNHELRRHKRRHLGLNLSSQILHNPADLADDGSDDSQSTAPSSLHKSSYVSESDSKESVQLDKVEQTFKKMAGKAWKSSATFANVSSTISRDNTSGESARQAKLFAEFAGRGRPCILISDQARRRDICDQAKNDFGTEISPVRPPKFRRQISLGKHGFGITAPKAANAEIQTEHASAAKPSSGTSKASDPRKTGTMANHFLASAASQAQDRTSLSQSDKSKMKSDTPNRQ